MRTPRALLLILGCAALAVTAVQGLTGMQELVFYAGPFLLVLGLIYFACFLAQFQGRGGPVPGLILTIGVIAPLLGVLDQDLGESIVAILGKAAANGVLFAWLAHAAFPDPGGVDAGPSLPVAVHPDASRIAFANTVILLIALTFCLVNNNLSTAVVLPLADGSQRDERLGGLLTPVRGDVSWRAAFLAGLVGAAQGLDRVVVLGGAGELIFPRGILGEGAHGAA